MISSTRPPRLEFHPRRCGGRKKAEAFRTVGGGRWVVGGPVPDVLDTVP